MIKTVEIKCIEDVADLILDLEYNSEIDRMRSPYLFRGMPDYAFKLTTSLRRNCADKQRMLEPSILRYFTKYASIEDPSLDGNIWKQLMVGQHHGLPTRLLDWSKSALIALHFATAERDVGDTDVRDGIVWRIDAREIGDMLPERYRAALKAENTNYFSVNMLKKLVPSLDEYDFDMGDHSMVIVEPPSTDQRIINQYAYFSVVPMGIEDIETDFLNRTQNTMKYIIRKDVRWDIRDLLDQSNISERVMYPGLDGLTKWIARHYYVKDNPYAGSENP